MVHLWGRRLHLLITSVFMVLAAQPGWAESQRYIVGMKSHENYRVAKDSSQRSGSFLGTRARVQAYLDHLEMAVVSVDADQLAEIQNNPNVGFVEAERWIPVPRFKKQPRPVRANHIPGKNSELTWGLKAVHAEQAWANTKGSGARVMVLDTGVDSSHPDLVNRLEAMRNFAGGGNDDEVGHGTHTSGTVLADGAGSGLLGVAPEARLLMGKVCTEKGCSSIAITQGVEWAVTEKVDVVNMSLGGSFIFPSEKQAYQKAEAAGVMIVAASGNGGNASVSYPAALDSVLAVGAVNPDLTKASFSQWGTQLDVVAPGVDVYSTVPQGTGREGLVKIQFADAVEEAANTVFQNSDPGTDLISGSLVDCGLGKAEDFSAVSVNGRIALIQRGEIAFAEKVKGALSAGAVGVVIYNNTAGLITGGLEEPTAVPVLMIEQAVGERVAMALDSGAGVSMTIGVVATDYASFQGTSMASPHAAGVAALVRAMNKKLTPAQVREVLKSTATPLLPNPSNQLGQGLINAEKAVEMAKSL